MLNDVTSPRPFLEGMRLFSPKCVEVGGCAASPAGVSHELTTCPGTVASRTCMSVGTPLANKVTRCPGAAISLVCVPTLGGGLRWLCHRSLQLCVLHTFVRGPVSGAFAIISAIFSLHWRAWPEPQVFQVAICLFFKSGFWVPCGEVKE